ncbi:sensor histidine kinase [Pollutibacter soli]|uniref:sensor histidine kinase n=1 Tax=Pollutibacter soli TaxID=3034157 RepID=UPI003013F620
MRVFGFVQQMTILAAFTLGYSAAEAQTVFHRPTIFTTDQGLSSNSVRSIDKCRNGFIWIGTGDGICRFDGNRFKVYQHNPSDSNSIADNRINCVLAVGDSIWAATDLGLSILNTRNNRFTNIQFNEDGTLPTILRQQGFGANLIYADRSGDIWIGTRNQGVHRYSPKTGKFDSFYWKRPDSIPENFVYNHILSICVNNDNDSIIYAGTVAGLLEMNRYTHSIKRHFFKHPEKKYENALNAFRRIYYHDDGLLYTGNWSTGMHIFESLTGKLIPLQNQGGPGEEVIETGIRKLLRKSRNEIWITSGMGVAVWDTDKKKITYRQKNDFNNSLFYGVDFIDESNRIWEGSTNGVYVFDPVVQQFNVWARENPANNQWGFNFYIIEDKIKNQLVILPRVGGKIHHFDLTEKTWRTQNLSIPKNRRLERFLVRGFAKATGGLYTIATDEGLFTYNDATGDMRPLHLLQNADDYRYGELIWDSSGKLWFSAYGNGLFVWNPATGTIKHYMDELNLPDTKQPFNTLVSLFEDSRKNIWISRNNGYVYFDQSKQKFMHFLADHDSTNTISIIKGFAEDAEGRVWVNGADGKIGFGWINQPEKGLTSVMDYYTKFGLTDFPKISSDNEGNIWGYTKKSLFRIDPKTLVPDQFDFSYGLREPDFYSFNIISNDIAVFGGRNDVVFANTKQLRRNTEKPVPYITQIQVLEKPNTITMVTVDTSQLYLKYWQNFFSFSFSAKAYTLGNAVRFRYRLSGFEDQWIEATDRNFVNYTNIPAGDYTFQVQAANNEGVWNEEISTLPVHVATAWWNMWIFQTLAVLAIAYAIWQLYQMRLKQVREKTRIKVEFEKKLANVEMSALLAQMNPHFLFNSLNSIDSYIIRNESKKASEYLNSFARLMRLILNNSRSNYITLKEELETLDLYLQMENLRFKDRFVYEILVDEDIDTTMVNIPPMLVQPYVENAIWHGLMHKEANKGKSKVSIHIKKTETGIICIIEDNGIGREKAAAISSKTGTRSRKSMGMRITEDRIEIINKLYNTDTKVFIEDLMDDTGAAEGTRVELTIPG